MTQADSETQLAKDILAMVGRELGAARKRIENEIWAPSSLPLFSPLLNNFLEQKLLAEEVETSSYDCHTSTYDE